MDQVKSEELKYETPKMKIGYKGLGKEMSATASLGTKEMYEIGVIYSKNTNKPPRVCSNEGYHYCNSLEDVFNFYPRNGENRFFKIEVLGEFTDEKGEKKSSTTSFKLLEELGPDFFKKWDEEAEIRKKEKELLQIEENLNLSAVRAIQKEYPQFHVGGSVGLFLHGFRLKRWAKSGTSDIDMVAPYFVLPEKFIPKEDPNKNYTLEDLFDAKKDSELEELDEIEITYLDAKASGNDFDETFLLNIDGENVKVDYKIDPKQRYEFITYKGFKYKVSPFWTIFNAKMEYAKKPSGEKHKNDIEELLNYKQKK